MLPRVFYGQNDFLLDFEAGLTRPETIERHKPYEPQTADSPTVLKCRACGTVNPVGAWLPQDWPEHCPNCGGTGADVLKLSEIKEKHHRLSAFCVHLSEVFPLS
jgi:hypothetical protein